MEEGDGGLGEAFDAKFAIQVDGGDIGAGHEAVDFAIGRIEFANFFEQLAIDGTEFFVERLKFFFRGFEFFVGGLEFFVGADHFFDGVLKFLAIGFEFIFEELNEMGVGRGILGLGRGLCERGGGGWTWESRLILKYDENEIFGGQGLQDGFGGERAGDRSFVSLHGGMVIGDSGVGGDGVLADGTKFCSESGSRHGEEVF